MITIIQEQPNNYNITENIVKLAFESAQHSDGNEHILVKKTKTKFRIYS